MSPTKSIATGIATILGGGVMAGVGVWSWQLPRPLAVGVVFVCMTSVLVSVFVGAELIGEGACTTRRRSK